MSQRPKVFREGMRVAFRPTAASANLYTDAPPFDSRGTVVKVNVGGSRRVSIPGPGGGLVYVHWDDDGRVMGVSRLDLYKASQARLPQGFTRAWEAWANEPFKR
jgi:hypothetical protein